VPVRRDGWNLLRSSGRVVTTAKGRKEVHRGGGINRFVSEILRSPDQKICVAVLCNVLPMNPGRVAHDLAAIACGEPYVRRYNVERLHSAIGCVTPANKLAGRDLAILTERAAGWKPREHGGKRPPSPVGWPFEPGQGYCPHCAEALRWITAWAEDRAQRRRHPSADPGTKTEGAARCCPVFPSGCVRQRQIEAF